MARYRMGKTGAVGPRRMPVVIPEPAPPDWITKTRARALAEDAGSLVPADQFERYRRWGLLGEPVDGRWPPATVERLLIVKRLPDSEPRLRPLPRRVLYLRRNILVFPIDPTYVRQAMMDTVPSLTRPVHKLAQVADALAAMGGRMAGRTVPRSGGHSRLRHPKDWIDLLMDTQPQQVGDADRFAPRIAAWYAWSSLLGTIDPSIPPEEQVLLVAILSLAHAKRRGEWMARTWEGDKGRFADTQAQPMTDPTELAWGEYSQLLRRE